MQRTLNDQKPASRRAQYSWALFDWANQPYFTLVTTFVFFPYFASDFLGDPVKGQAMLGLILGIAGATIAIVSPVLGAIADQIGPRKPWLAFFSAIYVIGCAGLWFAAPGPDSPVMPVAAAIILSTVAIEAAIVFNNAMLPGLAAKDEIGRLSGYAWGLGYIGGLVALLIVMLAFALPGKVAWTFLPPAPFLNLDPAAFEPERLTGPFSALWYLLFVWPLFVFVPDMSARVNGRQRAVSNGLKALARTVRDVRNYRNVAIFLIARMIYNDGITAIFAFGGVYARGVFGWDLIALGVFGIILAFFAAIGAALGGRLDDRIGSRPTIMISVAGLTIATLCAANITADSILGIKAATSSDEAGLFATLPEQAYMVCSVLIGLCAGPSQAASRTFMAKLAPRHLTTEFFGLYALSGKATAFVAPLAIAAMTGAFASQRAGLFAIAMFLGTGLLILRFVGSEDPADASD